LRQIDGALRFAVLKRIIKRHDPGFGLWKHVAQERHELFIGRVIGPHCEDSFRAEEGGELSEPLARVEGAVSFVNEILRGVVDVQQNGMEASARIVGIESLRSCESKEVTWKVAAARVRGELGTERDETLFVPGDDLGKDLDHVECIDALVLEGCLSGVAQSQSAHHDIKFGFIEESQSEVCEGDLHGGEETRHEITGSEDDLVDFQIL
jgi:hypothetical protein